MAHTFPSRDSSWLRKPSGAGVWLKFGLASAGAVAGAAVIAVSLHLVMSRSNELPSLADWSRIAVAAGVVPFRTSPTNTHTEVRVDQHGQRDELPAAITALDAARASAETAASQSQQPDSQYAAANPAATAAMPVVNEAVERGDSLALLGDYAAARLLYRFAAERGSADAALKLAKTYDATFLTKSVGLTPDKAEAARWYRAANELQSGIQWEE